MIQWGYFSSSYSKDKDQMQPNSSEQLLKQIPLSNGAFYYFCKVKYNGASSLTTFSKTCRVYMEKLEHYLEVLATLYTILTLLPSVAVTHMTVGWKTNVATLDDLLNLTLTLLSILIFFFLLTLLLGPLVGKSQVRRRSRCTLLTYTATCCEMATCPLPRQLALFLSGSCCTALCGFF